MSAVKKIIRAALLASIGSTLVFAVSGCAAKPAEVTIANLADFQAFMTQHPYTKYSYASATPPGTDQVIEVREDLNQDGVFNEGDGPIEAKGLTKAPKVVVVQKSLQLQLFFSYYGDGAGVSVETSPINLRSLVQLKAYPETKPAFVAIHKTDPNNHWSNYVKTDGDIVGFAYIEPAALAEYKTDKLSWIN